MFFSSGGSNYIVSAMSGSVKKYYLINKSALPKEIRDGLKGGDSYQYVDYINFMDIYGVTEDLKVYYCENGITEGASYGQLDGSAMNPNTPLVKVNENDNLKKAISSALGIIDGRDVTVGDIQSLKTLTLNNSEIKNVEGLSEAYGLKNLTLENLDIENLNGIEACTLLEKIYFKNSKIENYTKLENCINLKELYMYLPPTWESEECDNQVLYLCQGLKNASKITGLLEFGISGELTMLEYVDSNFRVETKKGNLGSGSLDTEGSKLNTLNSLSLINSSIKNIRIMSNSLPAETASGLLDLSNLPNLERYLGRDEKHEVKLPASLKEFTRMGGTQMAYLTLCRSLDFVEIDSLAGSAGSKILNSLQVMPTELFLDRKDDIKNWNFLTRVYDEETGAKVDCSRLKKLQLVVEIARLIK